MGDWEPLTDRIPLDMRRLATQLRRMKDRGGLTLPALAERTAQSEQAWASYLAAEEVPPLFAVKVLARASGADHERVTALWKLARRGRRGRGRPLPVPDPLDPLTAEEGLPARGGRLAALAALGALALAAFLTVLLSASPGTTRTPPPGAAPSAPATSLPHAAPGTRPSGAPHSADPSSPRAPLAPSTAPSRSPSSAAPAPSAPSTTTPPPPASAPATSGTPSSPSTPPPPSSTPSPTSTSTPLCLGVLLLDICIGG